MSERVNNSESFDQREQKELQIEIKKAEDFIGYLEVDVEKLRDQMNDISRESDEGNNEYNKLSKVIAQKRIQQRTIKELLGYIQDGAEIDTDDHFLNELRSLNKDLEENQSIETKRLVQMKDNIRVQSSALRFEIESELENSKARERLTENLQGRISLAGNIDEDTQKIFINSLIESIISNKGTTWVNEQLSDESLQISKGDFYRVLAGALSAISKDKLINFREVVIHITLAGKGEIFGANDDNYLKILEILLNSLPKEAMSQEVKAEESVNAISTKPEKKEDKKKPEPKAVEKKSTYSHNNSLNNILQSIQTKTVISGATELVVKFEGFIRYPYWDYKQWSWGNGTKVPGSIVNKIPKATREEIQKKPKKGKAKSLADRMVKSVGEISKEDALKDKEKHLIGDYNILKKYSWFNGMTKVQQMAILSFSYNNGVGKLTSKGVGLAKALKAGKNNKEIADYIIQYIYAGKKVRPGLVSRRKFEIEVFLSPELDKNQRYATVHPKTGVGLGKVTSDLIKELSGDNIKSGTIAARMERVRKVHLKKWDEVLVTAKNSSYIVSLNGTDEFIVDKQGNVTGVSRAKLAMNN